MNYIYVLDENNSDDKLKEIEIEKFSNELSLSESEVAFLYRSPEIYAGYYLVNGYSKEKIKDILSRLYSEMVDLKNIHESISLINVDAPLSYKFSLKKNIVEKIEGIKKDNELACKSNMLLNIVREDDKLVSIVEELYSLSENNFSINADMNVVDKVLGSENVHENDILLYLQNVKLEKENSFYVSQIEVLQKRLNESEYLVQKCLRYKVEVEELKKEIKENYECKKIEFDNKNLELTEENICLKKEIKAIKEDINYITKKEKLSTQAFKKLGAKYEEALQDIKKINLNKNLEVKEDKKKVDKEKDVNMFLRRYYEKELNKWYLKIVNKIFVSKMNNNDVCMIEILESGEFDTEWYKKHYPDVLESNLLPIEHYFKFGANEMRNPSERFSTKGYLENNPDVKESGMNALLHYVRYGIKESRVI